MVLVGVLVDLVCSAISSEAGKSRDPHELQTSKESQPVGAQLLCSVQLQ